MMNLPSKIAFTVFGFQIHWYGVLLAMGILIAVALATLEEKRKNLKKDTVIDMCLAIIPAGVIGARLYYVLFELERYMDDPISILYVWEGGLAIYGAVIGGLLAAFIFAKVRKIRFLRLADIIAPGLVLAQSIGRWGNFFNQEAYGLPITADMLGKLPILGYFPFCVTIEGAHYFDYALCQNCMTAANGAHMHLATFFYESAWCLLVFVIVWLTRKRMKHDGDTFLLYALLYSLERTFVEGLRGDSLWLIKPSAAGLADGIRVSQALSAAMFIIVFVFFVVRALREKKLGVTIWPKPLPACGECEVVNEMCDCDQSECECDCADGETPQGDETAEEAETTEEEAETTEEEAETTEEEADETAEAAESAAEPEEGAQGEEK